MRIEYENHLVVAPSGNTMLWVNEWQSPQSTPTRRCYVFVVNIDRWMDDAKAVVLKTDARHQRLLELVVAQHVEAELDQLVGL